MITLKGFWFLKSLIPQKLELFSSIMIWSKRGFSDFLEVLYTISFSVLEDIWLSFTCSTDLQNFRSCFKKFRANLPLPFGFKCKPFCPRYSALMLLLSMHSNSKSSRCLLAFRIVRFAFL